jgi:flagellar biosynthesis/type III secretory pathway protein FliH
VDELLTLMSVLTQDNRFAESLEGEGGKPQNMSSLLDRIEERGRQKGLDEGHREGRQEGFREGADQNRLENIRSIMETMKLTAKQAMEALKIPESEQSKYIARL